jgi:hypothetical protein
MVTVRMAPSAVHRPIVPAPAHPHPAATAHRPIARRPDITRTGIGRGRHDYWRRYDHRGRRNRSRHNDRRRQRHTNGKAEGNSGLSRQGHKPGQRGCKEQFRLHKIQCLKVFYRGPGTIRSASLTYTDHPPESCRGIATRLTRWQHSIRMSVAESKEVVRSLAAKERHAT